MERERAAKTAVKEKKLSRQSAAPERRAPAPARSLSHRAIRQTPGFDTIQTKRAISQPGDSLEHEADAMAERVASGRAASCGCGGVCLQCRAKTNADIQRKVSQASFPSSSSLPNHFLQRPGTGRPLDDATRDYFEERFAQDFSLVRIHADERAADSARAIHARAYTTGQDIVFGQGEFAPQTDSGQRLLAHELTHVVQQGEGRTEHIQRDPADPKADQATWYERAAGFSSGMEALQNVLTGVNAAVLKEKDDTYVFTDRTFTRPVVNRITGNARAFRNKVTAFIDASPADEPLLEQLRADLKDFDSALTTLEGNTPAAIGDAEVVGRSFVGGVTGAAGSFGGFLRLGLWDSWGQFLFDGSKQRADEAGEGFYQLMSNISDNGLGATVSKGASDWKDRFVQNLEDEHISAAGSQFGSTAFDIYFAGRGLVSAGQGMAGMSKAAKMFRMAGNPAPWRAALRLALREAVAFRGVGIHSGGGVYGSKFNLPTSGGKPTVRILRYVSNENDLVSKSMREPKTLLLDAEGNPRPLPNIMEQHKSASEGSPLQSAYPYADAETMLTANPMGVSATENSPYYVIIEVPLDEALMDVNKQMVRIKGLDPADFPELEVNRFGMQVSRDMLPDDLTKLNTESPFDPVYENLSPELQQWVTRNVIDMDSPLVKHLEGITVGEWEKTILAPDLKPYVVEVRPNPLYKGTPVELNVKPTKPSVYHPALNPESLWGIGSSSPKGFSSFKAQMDWYMTQAGGSGNFPLTLEEVMGGSRLSYLGGVQQELMWPFTFPNWTKARPRPDASSSSDASPLTPEEARDYMAWINAATQDSVSETLLELAVPSEARKRGVPAPGVLSNATREMGVAAKDARQAGGKITGLRTAPGVVSLEAHAPTLDRLAPIVQAVTGSWKGKGGVEAGVVIVLEGDTAKAGDVSAKVKGITVPSGMKLRIVSAKGTLLYSR